MNPIAELVVKAGLLKEAPAELTRRPWPCSVCGVDIGRSTYICDSCFKLEARKRRDCQLERARVSIPEKFRGVRFGTPEFAARVKASPAAIAGAISAVTGKRPVVTVIGASGKGKTTLACAILSDIIDRADNLACDRQTLERARFARYVDASQLALARQEHRLGGGAPEEVLRAKNASVLVVDEFGRDDRKAVDVGKIIHERESAGRLTIVATWMDQVEIKNAYDAGIARRLFEKATVIRLGEA